MPAAPVVHGSAAAFWLAQLTQLQMETVVAEACQLGGKSFVQKCDALRPALHLRKQPPAQRLQAYESRPQRNWQIFDQVFPKEAKEQRTDWRELGEKVRRGELVPLAPPAPPPIPPEALPDVISAGANLEGPRGAIAGAQEKRALGSLLAQTSPLRVNPGLTPPTSPPR